MAKGKPGRPKTVISDEDMAKAEDMAKKGCQDRTIAGVMGWDQGWLKNREDITLRLKKKRQEGKVELRTAQYDKAITSKDTTMQIWLGKNRLGQADKKDVTSGGAPIAPQINIHVDKVDLDAVEATEGDLQPRVGP